MLLPFMDVVIARFNGQVLSPTLAEMVFRDLIDCAADEELSLSDIRRVVKFTFSLRKTFNLDGNALLHCLEEIWEEKFEDHKIAKFILPLFLELIASGVATPGESCEAFDSVAEQVIAEEYKLNYPHILSYYVRICDRQIQVADVIRNTALVFARFLTKPRDILLTMGFDVKMLDEMHRCIKMIAKHNKSIMQVIQLSYAGHPKLGLRFTQLMSSSKPPPFG
jgi:hypothetical protein